jgi:hypothetical protein
MPRDGSGIYHRPPGTDAVTDTTIESSKYNANVADVEQDLNLPRPIIAGGTGSSTAGGAMATLGGELALQVITNFDSSPIQSGSFSSAAGATGSPIDGHAFSGIIYATDANNAVIEARDESDTQSPGRKYAREKRAGVWGTWKADGALLFTSDTPPAGAPDNSFWWESDTGLLYLRYSDGDSSQWVIAMPQPDVTMFLAKAGDTMTGPLVLAADPTAPMQAVTKQYSDKLFTAPMGLTYIQQEQARANIGALKKNYLINGAMMVSQDNGATAGNPANAFYYAADQFGASGNFSGGVGSYGQVPSPTPAGSPNRVRFTVTTADTTIVAGDLAYITQRVEGLRVADLQFGTAAAKTVTVAFGVRAPAGTYTVAFWNNTNGDRTYRTTYVIAAGEANTDVYKSVVIPGDVAGTWTKDTSLGLIVFWALMAGTTYQGASGVWNASSGLADPAQFNLMGTNGNVFELFDVGMYEGNVAPPFQVPDYATELLSCQRYYIKWTQGMLFGSGSLRASLGTYMFIPTPVPMRPIGLSLAQVGASILAGDSFTTIASGLTATWTPSGVFTGPALTGSIGAVGLSAMFFINTGAANYFQISARL